MGYRLSKITTRTGDAGTTGLGDGSRVAKDSARIHAIGEVDELNSQLGVLLVEPLPDDVAGWLAGVQHDLFDLGGERCLPGMAVMQDRQVERLEVLTEEFNRELSMLKEFILPGGDRAAGTEHADQTKADGHHRDRERQYTPVHRCAWHVLANVPGGEPQHAQRDDHGGDRHPITQAEADFQHDDTEHGRHDEVGAHDRL